MPVQRLENGARLVTPNCRPPERQFAHTSNFSVEWITEAYGCQAVESDQELIILFVGSGGHVEGNYGAMSLATDNLAILPGGHHQISVQSGGQAIVLATSRPDLPTADAIDVGEDRNARVGPLGRPYQRNEPLVRPWIQSIADIAPPADNPRIRFLQSSTMSVNLVLYDGPRGRDALSPHKHADIEQGSLALAGSYRHHLRLPWSSNADEWVEDVHLEARAGTLIVIPPGLIHTSEGTGEEHHFLLDIFAPPRRDFREKGWISNAGAYEGLLA